MQVSLGKLLAVLLFILVAFYYTSRSSHTNYPPGSDAAICAALPKDPSTLPFISYSTKAGFDECVARCMTSVMKQVCAQFPENSNFFTTRPEIKEQMLAGCTQNINGFITNRTRCPYLNCEP